MNEVLLSRRHGALYAAIALLFMFVIVAIGLSASGADIYVATTGDDDTGDGSVGNPYETIEKGITEASASDTVHVAAGTYEETVSVNKAITLQGNSASDTIIDGNGASKVVTISSADAVFNDLKVIDSGTIGTDSGIYVTGNDVTIADCEASSNRNGLFVSGASGITVTDSTFNSNSYTGIYLWSGSSTATLTGNTCNQNSYIGIRSSTGGHDILSNTVNDNSYGISIESGDTCTIENNTCNSNDNHGIRMNGGATGSSIQHNTLTNNDYGVNLDSASTGNEIKYNTITGNTYGVAQGGSTTTDARKNWWGHTSGPSGEGPGSGNSASTYVDYSPWLGAAVGSSPMTWGTDDSIQDAIDAAASGDTINVEEGSYQETLTVGKGLSLQGAGSSSTYIDGDGATTVVTISSANAEFKGFNVQNSTSGTGIYVTGNTVTVEECISNDHDNGIYLDSVSGCTIHDNTATSGGFGLFGASFTGSTIDNNTLSDNTYSMRFTNSDSNYFYDNTLDSNTYTAADILSGSESNIFKYNSASSNGHHGFLMITNCHSNNFKGNTVSSNSQSGFYIHSSNNVVVENNTISSNGDGIKLLSGDSASVQHNTISGSTDDGIEWGSSPTNAVVKYNSISSNSDGIDYSGTGSVDAEKNYWGHSSGPSGEGSGSGDSVDADVDYTPWLGATPGTTPMTWGTDDDIGEAVDIASSGDTIEVSAGTYNEDISISKSLTLQGAGSSTTTIDGSATGNVVTVTASGVEIDGFAITDSSSSFPYAGIRVNSVTSITIENCDVNNNQVGIYLDSCTGGTIQDNEVNNQTHNGIYLDDSTGVTVDDNDIYSNNFGVYIEPTGANTIIDNKVAYNSFGIRLQTPGATTIDDNIIRGNRVKDSTNDGIQITDGVDNEVDDNVIFGSGSDGIHLHDCSGTDVTANELYSNDQYGIDLADGTTGVDIHTNQIYSNTLGGMRTDLTSDQDCERNWWGHASGPSGEGPGSGDSVSTYIDYSPWLGATPATSPMTWGTDDSIQDAIDAASSGDTINVEAGTYTEDVDIDKAITLVGADKDTTTIDTGTGDTVTLTASGITMSGFTVGESTGTGILISSNNNDISDVLVWKCYRGIRVNNADGNTFDDVEIDDPSDRGIELLAPSGHTIDTTTLTDITINHASIGLYIQRGSSVTVERLLTYSNSNAGVYDWYSTGTSITDSEIRDNTQWGIHHYQSTGSVYNENKFSNNVIDDLDIDGGPGAYSANAEDNYWDSYDPDVIESGIDDPNSHADWKPFMDETFTYQFDPDTGPTTVYVDDDYTSGNIDNDGDPSSPSDIEVPGTEGLYWGWNAFDSIQDAIDRVQVDGTVNIAAGTYTETISIPKDVVFNSPSTVAINGDLSISSNSHVRFVDMTVSVYDLLIGSGSSLSFEDSANTITTQDITVSGTLNVNSSTIKFDCTSDGEYGMEVTSTGKLYIRDDGSGASTITAVDTSYEYFFKVLDGSTFEMTDSVLSECGWGSSQYQRGIEIETDNAVLENNTIKDNGYSAAIVLNGADNYEIWNNDIYDTTSPSHNGFNVMFVYDSDSGNIGYNEIRDISSSNHMGGLEILSSASVNIKGNRIRDLTGTLYSCGMIRLETNCDNSILKDNSVWDLNGGGHSTVYQNYGISIDNCDSVTLSGNSVSDIGGTYANGLAIRSTVTATYTDCNVTNINPSTQGNGLSFWHAGSNSVLTFTGCSFTNIKTKDVRLNYNADVTFIDCTFDTGKLQFDDANSDLTVKEYLDIHVKTDAEANVQSADIKVYDGTETHYSTSGYSGSDPQTGASGLVENIAVTDRVYEGSVTATARDTKVSVKKGGWEDADRPVDMSTEHTEYYYEDYWSFDSDDNAFWKISDITPDYVDAGDDDVGILQLDLYARDTDTFTTFTTTFSGDDVGDIVDGTLWLDDGDDTFETGEDTAKDSDETPSGNVITFSISDALSATTGYTYFVSVEIASDATSGNAIDLKTEVGTTITMTTSGDNKDEGNPTGSSEVDDTAPTIDMGGPYSGNEASSIPFDASGSSDGGSGIASYEWDLDNDAQYDDDTGSTSSYTWNQDGSYTIGLRVTDNVGNVATDSLSVTVNNVAPSPSHGGPYSINEGQSVDLDGSATDPGDDTLTYAWDLDDDGQYDDATGAGPVVSWSTLEGLGLNDGVLDISFEVSDDDTSVTSDTTLTITNVAPTASHGGTYSINEGQSVDLDASGSSDPNGNDVLTYAWDLDDDGQYDDATGATPTVSWSTLQTLLSNDGTYDISVEVSDDDTSVTADTTLTINNVAPTASHGGPYSINEGQSVDLDASGSSDPNAGDTLTYAWDLDDDGQYDDATGATPTVSWATIQSLLTNDGQYDISVEVSDDDTSTTAETTLTISNVAPTASHGGPYSINEGQSVDLDASGSSDPCAGDTLTYAWDLDDDGQYDDATGATPTVSWATIQSLLTNDGQYDISLEVSDDDTATTTDTTLTISNVAPTASHGGPYSINEGQSVDLDASGSSDPCADDTLTYAWDLDDDGQYDDATGATPTVSWSTLQTLLTNDGQYDISVEVSDDDTSSTADTTLTISNVAPTASHGGPYSINEGQSVDLDASGSSDPCADDTLTYAWDLDDDGQYDDATGATPTVSWSSLQTLLTNDGQYDISVEVSDDDTSSTADTTLTISNVAPTASHGGPYSINEGQSVDLDASGSTDPCADDTLTYAWDLDDDGQYDDATGATPTVSWSSLQTLLGNDGQYDISVEVSDDDTSSTSDTTLTINNVAPTASHGGPYSINEGQSVDLDASGSSDPCAGDTLTYAWDLDDDGQYDDATGATPTVSWATIQSLLTNDGQYDISVEVSDDDTSSTSDTTLTISNVAPTASHGGPYSINEGQSVDLDASGSSDPCAGDTLTYAWDLDDDGQYDDATGATPTVSWSTLQSLLTNDGQYDISVEVSDDDTSSTADTTLTISNVAPTASHGGPYSINEGQSVDLDASGSSDPCADDTLTYAWDLDDDGQYDDATGATPTVSWSTLQSLLTNDGQYDISVEVSDDDTSSTADTTLTIANVAPTASHGGPYSINEGQSVDLDASGSSDPNAGDTLTYAWDLDDDGQYDDATGATPTVSWATIQSLLINDGQYDISVEVSDDDTSSTADTTLTISNVAPTAGHGGPYSINEGQSVDLDASGSSDPCAGDTLTYAWDLDDDGQYDDATGATPTVGWSTLQSLLTNDGQYDISVEVSDDDTSTSADTTLTISNVAPTASHGGPYSINEGQSVDLDASGSSDPCADDTLTYAWDLDDDGQYDDATGATPTVSWATIQSLLTNDGQYDISVEVSDDDTSSTADTTLTIANIAPTASHGGPYSINEGQSVDLDASSSSDPCADDTLTYAWDLDDDGQYDDATGATPTVSWSTLQSLLTNDGQYDISVEVSDDDTSSTADTTLTIANVAPTASHGGPYSINEGQSVDLDASGSSDPCAGDTLTYAWDLDDDGQYDDATGATPTVSWATIQSLLTNDGQYDISVEVSDDDTSSTADTTLTISNVAPTASHGGPYSINEGQSVDLDASGSSDPCAGDTLTYAWDLDDDGQYDDATGATPSVSWSTLQTLLGNDGQYDISVEVSDDDTSSTADTTLTISNVAPTANHGGPYSINEGQSVDLDASGSSDPCAGDTLTYAWDLDDDGQYDDATGATPTVSWSTLQSLLTNDGQYDISVEVSDDDTSSTADTTLTIANVAPTASHGGPYSINEGQSVDLDASGSSDPCTGDTLTYAWDLDDDGQYDDATGITPTVSWSTLQSLLTNDGQYDISVEVSDDDTSSTADTTLTISNVAPTASHGGPYSINEGQSVDLDASGSSDPCADDTLTYAWDLDDDGQYDDATGSTPTVSWSTLQSLLTNDGQYDISVEVSDDDTSSTADTTLTIANVAPTASHGGPYSINEGQSVDLDASGSSDPCADDTLTYAWDLDDDGQFDDATGATPTVSWSTLQSLLTNDGQYDISVEVSDDDTSSTADTTLTISNVAPTASHGGPYSINEGQSVDLDASGSSDPCAGDTLTYAWDLDDDGQYDDATGATPTVAWSTLEGLGLNDGTHDISVEVSDDDTSSTADTTLTISNVAPTADAGGPYTIDEGDDLDLDASGSSDPSNDALTYAWDLDDDGQYDDATGETPTVAWSALQALLTNDGQYDISVEVSDDDTSSTADTTLTINNVAPTASHGGPYSINEGQSVDLDASGSSDPCAGDTLTYAWDLDDDGQYDDATGSTPTVSWASLETLLTNDGQYDISVEVSDDDTSSTADTTLTIANVAPTANHGGPYSINEGQSVDLDASGSSDPCADDTLTYAWDLDYDGQYDDATGATPTVSWSTLQSLLTNDGQYDIRVEVSDDDTSSTADTTLTIANVAPTASHGGPYSINEGQSVDLDASGSSDPCADDTLTYAWDLDDDGQYDDATGATPTVSWSTLQSLLTNDGQYDISVEVSDDDTSSTADTTLTISNVAPTASHGGPYSINEGQSVDLDASGSSDPCADDTLTYAWDLDDDGQYDDATGATPTVSWATLQSLLTNDGQYDISVEVSDDDTSSTADTTLTIANVAPTASHGGPYSINEGQSVDLDASGSSDPCAGDTLTYAWDLDDDGQYDDATGATPTVSWSALQALLNNDGQYDISLEVSDDDTSSTADTTLTIANVAPTASHGGPYTINEGESVDLDASGSSDPCADDTLTYAWDLDDDGQYDDATGATPTIAWSALEALGLNDGTHDISIEVSDDDTSSTADTTLTITNIAPTADAGGPYTIDEGDDLDLDASGSSDPSNDVLTYAWDLDNDGQYDDATGETPTVSWSTLEGLGLNDGSSTVGVEVSDDDTSSTDTASLTISNIAPTADTGGPYSINEGDQLDLDGSGSSDPNANDLLTYAWDLDNDGQYDDATGESPTVAWSTLEALGLNDGALPIGLEVTDDDTTTTDTGTLNLANIAPTAEAGGPYSIDEGDALTVAGSGGDSNSNDLLTYAWDLDDDGSYETSAPAAGTIPWSVLEALGLNDGSHTVTLRVSDDDTFTTDTAALLLANVAPTADAGGPYAFDEGDSLPLSGSGTDSNANDLMTYAWDLDNDGQYDDAIGSVAEPTWNMFRDFGWNDGDHTIGLKVSDDDTFTTDSTTVTLNNIGPTAETDGPHTIDEGDDVTLDASSSSDPNANDVLSYSWDLDNDGQYDDATGESPTVAWSTLEGLGLNDGDHTIGLRVSDDDTDDTDSTTLSIDNVGPTAETDGPYTIDEGSDAAMDASSSSEPNGNDVLTYEWDLDNDGQYDDATGESPTVAWSTLEGLGLNDGDNTIGLRVSDDDTDDTTTTTLTIDNVGPTAETDGPHAIDEGDDVTLDASSSDDPNGNDVLTYEWDLDNDGQYDDATGEAPTVSWATLEGLGLNDGDNPIGLRVSDDDTDDTDSTTLTIDNVGPTAETDGPYTIDEGSDAIIDASSSSDPNANDVLTYEWDLDNDGQYDDATGESPTVSWSTLEGLGLNDGDNTIGLRVSDDDTDDTTSTTLTINNVGPTGDANGPHTIDEGDDVTLDASSSSDPNANDVLTYEWDLDNDGQYDDATGESPTVSWSTLEGLGLNDGDNPIGLRVSDDDTDDTTSTTLTIDNVAPSADAGGPYTINEGDQLDLSGSGSDENGNDVLTYSWDIDDDGEHDDATGTTPSISWATLETLLTNDGIYTIELKVGDDDTFTLDTAQVTIDNVAPTAEAGGPYSIDEGDPVDLSGSGSDVCSVDDGALTYAWDLDDDGAFDDATGTTPTVSWATLDALGLNDGTHTLELRVSDDDTSTMDTAQLTINNIEPTITLDSPTGGEQWAGSNDIEWTAYDPGDTLTIDIEYWDGSGWSSIATAEADDGSYSWDTSTEADNDEAKIRVTANDNQGSVDDESASFFEIDNTAPTTTDDYVSTWHDADVDITLTPSDAGVGVDYTWYRINGGDWQTGTALTITVSGDGVHTVDYGSIDLVGNNESANQIIVTIDTTPPELKVYFDQTAKKPKFEPTDNLDSAPDMTLLSKFGKNRVYKVTDHAGNTATIKLRINKQKIAGWKIKTVTLKWASYNDGSQQSFGDAKFRVQFKMSSGVYKSLKQAISGGTFWIDANYRKSLGVTKMKIFDGALDVDIYAGIKTAEMLTDAGAVDYNIP